MEYNFREIEDRWQRRWKEERIYQVSNNSSKPKYYVLDMFPYPSGAGLHVGHPLGYIASDIYARFKRLQGFEVLHPMGFDAFGLPAEQYAIETGQHPALTTAKNIANFKRQLDRIGFCFDWSREVNTSDPQYYRWTQWIFLQLYDSWFNRSHQRAERIAGLIHIFETEGNLNQECPGDSSLHFSSGEWKTFGEKRRQGILMDYRLAYSGVGEVNWCEELGTVLANDEVINGVSERGGYPVVKKKLRQWYLRITEYAERLLSGLDTVNFSQSMKDMQTNWIGKSRGAEILFDLRVPGKEESKDIPELKVYTTRPDTIYGVDFMVLAPEHELVGQITAESKEKEVAAYLDYVNSRSERERLAEKAISGCDTGAVAINPFNSREIPVWISEYVLAGYGTGAIMGVPCGDERDHRFARHFHIPVTNILGDQYTGLEANPTKTAVLSNSDFLDGLVMTDAIETVIQRLELDGTGRRRVNYKMRDAAFSRQRYWGEPFPIVWEDGIAFPLKDGELPLELPHVEHYQPGPEGEGPLANISEWTDRNLETSTMPGYAGSSWYFLRYMDPHNEQAFCSREASDYWGQVDFYIGGTEHAVGHLLYSRMWTKALFDLGYIGHDEPYKRLVNQGMIQGSSRLVYRQKGTGLFVSAGKLASGAGPDLPYDTLHVEVSLVDGVSLDMEAFRHWKPDYQEARFITEDNGTYICGTESEKMSKSKYNTVSPDDIVDKYGADTFRMYEMFLGPVELSKPWDTKGIEGVYRFLKKFWRMFYSEDGKWLVTDAGAALEEWKILHRTIKKAAEDTERLSFNTAVSQFMICVNELTALNCHDKGILSPLLVTLAPYAPHISEELWRKMGHESTILDTPYPAYQESYLKEDQVNYPVAVNGRTRTEISFPAGTDHANMEQEILQNGIVRKWLAGKQPKKIIIVEGRMINVVV
ncbi:MAG TPA: leucine--tRNA ligase [Chitinophagaceae bacterium]|nr:leucine--tRNA ligase [Chitinophagaceae bacterium]